MGCCCATLFCTWSVAVHQAWDSVPRPYGTAHSVHPLPAPAGKGIKHNGAAVIPRSLERLFKYVSSASKIYDIKLTVRLHARSRAWGPWTRAEQDFCWLHEHLATLMCKAVAPGHALAASIRGALRGAPSRSAAAQQQWAGCQRW